MKERKKERKKEGKKEDERTIINKERIRERKEIN